MIDNMWLPDIPNINVNDPSATLLPGFKIDDIVEDEVWLFTKKQIRQLILDQTNICNDIAGIIADYGLVKYEIIKWRYNDNMLNVFVRKYNSFLNYLDMMHGHGGLRYST